LPDFRVGASRDLPINIEQAFDIGAATDRIFEWAGWDGASPPDHGGGNARYGFLVYDATAPDVRTGYALPFADVTEGTLYAFQSGVEDAEANLDTQADLSADTRHEARKVLDGYRTRMNAEGGQTGTTSPQGEEDRSAPLIAVVPLSRDMRGLIAPGATDIPQRLLDQIQDRTVLSENSLYVLNSVVSNDRKDYYGTRMRPNSLRNYAEDAIAGAPFCNSHNTDILPFGRSFDGRYKANRGTGVHQTFVDTYVPVDLNVNGTDTTHLVKGIRMGVVRDISIGFDPGAIFCSIDGKRFPLTFSELFAAFDDEKIAKSMCLDHFPGVEYTIDGRKVECIGEVDDARMIEHSPVYRGATPGAAIQDVGTRAVRASSSYAQLGLLSPGIRFAAWMAEAGRLDRYAAEALEHRTRGLSFPSTTTRRFSGVRPPAARTTTEDSMHPERQAPVPDDDDEVPAPAPSPAAPPPAPPQTDPPVETGDPPVTPDPAPAQPPSSDARGMAAGIRAVLTQHGLVPANWDGDVQVRITELCTERQDLRGRLSAADTELERLRPLADVSQSRTRPRVPLDRRAGLRQQLPGGRVRAGVCRRHLPAAVGDAQFLP
jgi:hypothetical protein